MDLKWTRLAQNSLRKGQEKLSNFRGKIMDSNEIKTVFFPKPFKGGCLSPLQSGR